LHARRGIALCVTTTDLRTARPRVFATPHAAVHRGSADLPLVDACMASCSAPMLLPPMRLPVVGEEGALWCDGGLWATSPVAVALAEAFAMTPDDRPIEVLSVGTCAMPVPAAVLARLPGTGIGLWIRGLRALQVTGDAQAAAAVEMVRGLVPQLRRPVRFLRLRDPEPTDAEASIVRLDHASPAAFEVMEGLARRGAELNGATGDLTDADRGWLSALLRPAAAVKPVGVEDPAASGP
jgi:predicted acylesterase/phospholipase RssA